MNHLDFETFETLLDDLLSKVREAKYLDIQAASSGSHFDADRADEAADEEETAYQHLLDLVREHCDTAHAHAHRHNPYRHNP